MTGKLLIDEMAYLFCRDVIIYGVVVISNDKLVILKDAVVYDNFKRAKVGERRIPADSIDYCFSVISEPTKEEEKKSFFDISNPRSRVDSLLNIVGEVIDSVLSSNLSFHKDEDKMTLVNFILNRLANNNRIREMMSYDQNK